MLSRARVSTSRPAQFIDSTIQGHHRHSGRARVGWPPCNRFCHPPTCPEVKFGCDSLESVEVDTGPRQGSLTPSARQRSRPGLGSGPLGRPVSPSCRAWCDGVDSRAFLWRCRPSASAPNDWSSGYAGGARCHDDGGDTGRRRYRSPGSDETAPPYRPPPHGSHRRQRAVDVVEGTSVAPGPWGSAAGPLEANVTVGGTHYVATNAPVAVSELKSTTRPGRSR